MKLIEIINKIENWAPLSYQESYDNSGLLVGDKTSEISGAIICLDSTEEVIDEAILKGYNLILAHHPIVFKGLKKFNGSSYVERAVMKAIKNDIAIYACHTNLDNVRTGVNKKISSKLGLVNQRILRPKGDLLSKLVFYCPSDSSLRVKQSLFDAGAGKIGNYSECSFSSEGIGTFTPGDHSNPKIGAKNEKSEVKEDRIEVLVENQLLRKVISQLQKAHPYEEVAYEVYEIKNLHQNVGSGMVGDLVKPTKMKDFLEFVKEEFKLESIKYTILDRDIRSVAVCGGVGSFLLEDAKKMGADVFITSDYKYHEFFEAERKISILDIGHYESEYFTLELIKEFLTDNFPKFAADLTEINTNPVKYF